MICPAVIPKRAAAACMRPVHESEVMTEEVDAYEK